ncbi:MAG: VWA domain-containing protein [Spirochaetales bacterium]|nr:VWA domain-containing protein [Spirochaetales bacterium]
MKKILLLILSVFAFFSCSEFDYYKDYTEWEQGVSLDFHSCKANYNSAYDSTVVNMYFSVWQDDDSASIDDLTLENVTVLEDGNASDTESMSSIENSINFNIILLLDFSYSMVSSDSIDSLKEAAKTFIAQKSDNAKIAIVKFATSYSLEQDFTDDADTLNTIIDNIESDEQKDRFTALYDAIDYSVVSVFDNYDTTSNALIIFSDGADNRSDCSLDDAYEALKTTDVICYSIGLGSSIDTDALEELSIGGGLSTATTSEELSSLFSEISIKIGSIYKLEYISPTNNSKYHELEVTIESSYGNCGYSLEYRRKTD